MPTLGMNSTPILITRLITPHPAPFIQRLMPLLNLFVVVVAVVVAVVVVMTQSISLRRKATLDYEGKLDVE